MLVKFRYPIIPNDECFGLRENINSLFENFFETDYSPIRFSTMLLRNSIVDNGDNVEFIAEIPGVDKKDMKISVIENNLIISGERKAPELPDGVQLVNSERVFGTFSRSVKIPFDFDQNKVSAEFKDGLLKVTLPKTEKAKPKEISIQVK